MSQLSDNEVVKLPAHIREELMLAALHLPLAVANLRAPVSSTLSCTDATCFRGGGL